MVWTDPPYGVDYAAKNAFLNRSDRGNRIQTPIENDKLTAGETGHMFKQALELARHFAEPGAACYATVPSGPLLFYFFQAFTAAGLVVLKKAVLEESVYFCHAPKRLGGSYGLLLPCLRLVLLVTRAFNRPADRCRARL
jgi:hypothetical protein